VELNGGLGSGDHQYTPASACSPDASEAVERVKIRATLERATGFDDTTSPLTALVTARPRAVCGRGLLG
jgi:hypothetical protein